MKETTIKGVKALSGLLSLFFGGKNLYFFCRDVRDTLIICVYDVEILKIRLLCAWKISREGTLKLWTWTEIEYLWILLLIMKPCQRPL